MKNVELFFEAIAGWIFGIVVFTIMFLLAFIIEIPEIPKTIRMHAM